MKRRALSLRTSGPSGLVLLLLLLALPAAAQAANITDLTSSADYNKNGWANDESITITWGADGPVSGYSYAYSPELATLDMPDEVIDTHEPSATCDWGHRYWFAVRACDRDGVWGEPSYLEVRNDTGVPWPWYVHVNELDEYTGSPGWFSVPITRISGWWRAEGYSDSGIWYEQVSVDGGPFRRQAPEPEFIADWGSLPRHTRIPAPKSGVNDGVHHVVLRGVDFAGNVGEYGFDVGIDTGGRRTSPR